MNVIICLDQNNGMLFNNRRQSRDRIVRKNILEYINGAKLYMDEYSFKQFSEEKADNIIVDNNLENATEHDFCFVERQEVRIEEINKLIVYRWDKIYPADNILIWTILNATGRNIGVSGLFPEKIIREIYQLI